MYTFSQLRRSWEGISIWEGWIFSNILIWEGIEKVFLWRRTWEVWKYYRIVEMDLRREKHLRRKCTLPLSQLMLLFWKLIDETQMSKPLEATRHHNSTKLLILLPLRADLLCILHYETPCKTIFLYLYWFQIFKDQCKSVPSISVAVLARTYLQTPLRLPEFFPIGQWNRFK